MPSVFRSDDTAIARLASTATAQSFVAAGFGSGDVAGGADGGTLSVGEVPWAPPPPQPSKEQAATPATMPLDTTDKTMPFDTIDMTSLLRLSGLTLTAPAA
jgi:hypothetical protein